MDNPQVTLFAKLARITQKMERIRKTGYNAGQKYNFATDTDVIESVRDAMKDENIACVASMSGYQILEGGKTQYDKPIFHTVCEFEFTFVCGDTGAVMSSKWFNEALDSGDKGFNKCATAALKYFFMKTFLITTGEPDEHDSDDVQAGEGSAQNASKSSKKPSNSSATSTPAHTPASASKAALNGNGHKPDSERTIAPRTDAQWSTFRNDIMTALANTAANYPHEERWNTLNKMHDEGAFEGIDTNEAVKMVMARLAGHRQKAG